MCIPQLNKNDLTLSDHSIRQLTFCLSPILSDNILGVFIWPSHANKRMATEYALDTKNFI